MKFLLLTALLSALIHAHPGPHPQPDPVHLSRRSAVAKKCANSVGLMKRKRHAMRRQLLAPGQVTYGGTNHTAEASVPSYDFLKNDTCILTPETSPGPYIYPRSEVLRQNITEDQPGVPFELDIGLIDIHTCEPLTNVLIDIWHCNWKGKYSSFTGLNPDVTFPEQYLERTGKKLQASSGQGDTSFLATDNTTWLRGMWPTDRNGVSKFNTVYPGFYTDRAVHVHLQAHTNWTLASNGTIAGGKTVSTGQIFFPEDVSAEVMSVQPYANHTQTTRKPVNLDGVYVTESETGAMTILDTEPLDGKDYKNGVLGYITFGVDTTAIHDGSTKNPNPKISAVPSAA
ncbi:aromatic compound dioxygenase [Aspergillus heteromorphus CBS 117.55]|uniref:Aromatic compound dioxygenase n=1 Tax=Aspergillus heteromorphus CBS 117.55 TaxID=1448321 RepID=A0A317WNY8_9EURO|nr:aromatic compound dioxygenase [Aspergillus heteromorphus CBS 117.55]PWY86787.1 aromatic compound dioxygenase [Aspergillus heteromorphus CBS 117.55]